RTRVVSAIEAGERATKGVGTAALPARHSPTKAPRSHVDHAPPVPAPVAATQSVAQAAEAPQEAPAPAATPSTEDQSPARSENPTMAGSSGDGVISVSPNEGNDAGPITVSRRGRGG